MTLRLHDIRGIPATERSEMTMNEEDIESVYWRFDAMRKGLRPFEDRKNYSERDNLKAAVRFHLPPATLGQAKPVLAEAGTVAVPIELLSDLRSLDIECRDEQPMDFRPLDALNTRILAAQGPGTA
jgi:hypothetical protein